MNAAFRPRFRRSTAAKTPPTEPGADAADVVEVGVDDGDDEVEHEAAVGGVGVGDSGVGREAVVGGVEPDADVSGVDVGDSDGEVEPGNDVGGGGVGDSDEDAGGVGLGDDLSEVELGDDSDGEWLAYELHGWSLESRVMLQQLLTVDQVVHSWQGTTLLVHESLEQMVDSLIDEAEEAEEARQATTRPIGPDDDLTAFEIGDWSPEMRNELMLRLEQASVPYILEEVVNEDEEPGEIAGDAGTGAVEAGGVDGVAGDDVAGDDIAAGATGAVEVEDVDAVAGDDVVDVADGVDGDAGDGWAEGDGATSDDELADGAWDREASVGVAGGWDLWVREADEARVDLIIDDLLTHLEEEDFTELEGLEVNDLLSDLFVACDRLSRDVRDPDGVRDALSNGARLAGVRTPFGFSAPDWRNLRRASGELLELLEEQHADEDELRTLAQQLSDTLRGLV